MAVVFGVTLFLSAALLFLIQPMIARMILPLLGGTPAIWNTCMVFFQAMLLAGYAYAHALPRWLGVKRHAVVHLLVLALPFLALPLVTLPLVLTEGIDPARSGSFVDQWRNQAGLRLLPIPNEANPIPWLILLLLASVGVPFFVVATTSPLLQKWFAQTRHPAARDPYFLYGAGNVGSMVALLGYPLFVEPYLELPTQGWLWIGIYVLLFMLTGACSLLLFFSAAPVPTLKVNQDKSEEPPALTAAFERFRAKRLARLEPAPMTDGPPTWGRRLYWLALACLPSSLLFGVTSFLATDIASVPLLWIMPLTLYLLTFILAFRRSAGGTDSPWLRALPALLILQPFLFAVGDIRPIWVLFALHLATFFLVALACHVRLARSRPGAEFLTEFYLWLSAGGVLGGLFNTLVAPLVFDSMTEYPLALVLVCLLLPAAKTANRLNWGDILLPLGLFVATLVLRLTAASVALVAVSLMLRFGLPAALCFTFRNRPVRFALGVGALFLAGGVAGVGASKLVYKERGFFGIVRIIDQHQDERVDYREFLHGRTVHGRQALAEDRAGRRTPLTYYFRNGPIGELFDGVPRPERVAVLGLGAGTLASYAEPGQDWTFYEIDPAVKRIAQDYFTYLGDAAERGAAVCVDLGDARLRLRDAPEGHFDMIFADAFSSDAVPVHLLTREAVRLYLRKLRPGGLLIFNVTNRYLDLEPMVGNLATDANLVGRARIETRAEIDSADFENGKTPSHWVVLARDQADLGRLAGQERWRTVHTNPEAAVWTDHYSNLIGILRWR